MQRVTLTNGSWYETGCIFDGVHGRYNLPRLVYLANAEGMVLPEVDRNTLLRYTEGLDDPGDAEAVDWLALAAEQFLNDLLPEGYAFTWHDGDFRLDPVADDEPRCDTCGSHCETVEWCGECGNCTEHCTGQTDCPEGVGPIFRDSTGQMYFAIPAEEV